ncbi:MAG: DUF2911 domain-containing protein [Thermoanaerobaculia bacterium]|nr:hypothetical protein [Thermoanaerobaculia bacterium]MCK6681772.1 DUF2911 domain-containing protein [Thermoanaerobaculia bacterium]
MRRTSAAFLLAVAIAVAAPLAALTPPLRLPPASPKASVSQTVGMTEITVRYSRPAVKGRKVWGQLVPFGEVWRTGADENTTIQFSTPVTVGGKSLPAGIYGLHTIPGEKEWTVILSTQASAWGSYSYDEKEDAVRLTAVPRAGDLVDRLQFTLEDPTDRSVSVTLAWEKIRVAFPVTVDTSAVVLASLKEQLRGLPRFSWQGWNQAAAWCLKNDTALDQGIEWADRSLKMNKNFTNQMTKAGLLEKKGDPKGAADLRQAALSKATEPELNQYGYQLLGEKKTDEAIKLFERNTKEHPGSWNTWDSLAEAWAAAGNKKNAVLNYEKALSMTEDEEQKKRIRKELEKLK